MTYDIASRMRPQQGHAVLDLPIHRRANGQKAGANWAAAVGSQPLRHQGDRVLTMIVAKSISNSFVSRHPAADIANAMQGEITTTWMIWKGNKSPDGRAARYFGQHNGSTPGDAAEALTVEIITTPKPKNKRALELIAQTKTWSEHQTRIAGFSLGNAGLF